MNLSFAKIYFVLLYRLEAISSGVTGKFNRDIILSICKDKHLILFVAQKNLSLTICQPATDTQAPLRY